LMHPTATYWCQHLSAALPEHLIEQWKNYWFTAWVYNTSVMFWNKRVGKGN
jgi:hypothetical protein